MLIFYKSLLQLVLSPIRGWEDISHDGLAPRYLLKVGFLPLLLLTSLSIFMLPVYHLNCNITALFQHAIVSFVKFFLSYFIAVFSFSLFLPALSYGEWNEKRAHTFIIYTLSLMAIIEILQNGFPIELAITYFLPIYVAIVMWRGMRYLDVEEHKVGSFMTLSILSIIVPPFIIAILFGMAIPKPY